MYSIGALSKVFHLSRSTLLYYDSIGLLQPSVRTAVNYRRYSEDDFQRLQEICRYRETGMSLEDIKAVLDKPKDATDRILEKRLDELNQTIKKLHIQRQLIIYMLNRASRMDSKKEVLVKALQRAGMSDDKLAELHREYERLAPEEHQSFLEFLGISTEEIAETRRRARMNNPEIGNA